MDAATLIEAPVISIQDEAIDQLRAEYMPLAITDLTDKQQLAVVKKARLHVRDIRIAAEKKHKELKADAWAYGQACDAELRRIKGRLEPIETHLKAEEEKPKKEAERLAFEAEQAKKALIRERLKNLAAVDCIVLAEDVAELSNDDYLSMFKKAEADKQARDEQLAAEAEARRVEAEKLAKERAELDRLKAEQAAELEELRKLKAEREEAETAAAAPEPVIVAPPVRRLASSPSKQANPDRERLKDLAWRLQGITCPTLSEPNKGIQCAIEKAIGDVHDLVAKSITDLA